MTTHHATLEAQKPARYCFKSGDQYATQHNSTCYLGAKALRYSWPFTTQEEAEARRTSWEARIGKPLEVETIQ